MFASSPQHSDPVVSRKTHWVSFRFSISQDTLGFRSTSARTWCSSAARLHGSFVTVKTQASSRPSGHRARVILLQSTVIALFFGVFLLPAQHAHAVFARISVHETQNPQFFRHIHHKRSTAAAAIPAAGAARPHGKLCALSFKTHLLDLFLSLCADGARQVVWLVQSRRRPEKWTRTRKAGSRGSVTPDPVS